MDDQGGDTFREHRVSPSAAFRKPLAVLLDDESLGEDPVRLQILQMIDE